MTCGNVGAQAGEGGGLGAELRVDVRPAQERLCGILCGAEGW